MVINLTLYLLIYSVCAVESTNPTEVIFYDFDQTITKVAFGKQILDLCQEDGARCDQPGDLVNTLTSLPISQIKKAFGGKTGIKILKQHFDRILSPGSSIQNIFVLSRSWEHVGKKGMG
eukprot:786344_1